METFKDGILKISVRNLVEFVLRSGDIDNRTFSGTDVNAMQEGARLHRKIQGKMARYRCIKACTPLGDARLYAGDGLLPPQLGRPQPGRSSF